MNSALYRQLFVTHMASASVGKMSIRLQHLCRVRYGLMRCTQIQNRYTSQKDAKDAKSKKSAIKTSNKISGSPSKTDTPSKPASQTVQASSVPFDNTSYQVPEYFGHNVYSYYDIENEMVSSRVPQPSSSKRAATK